jgi:hypothetical protein
LKLAAQGVGSGDEHRAQGIDCSSSGLDGTETGHTQHADRLYRSVSELGCSACLARQHGSRGRFGVDRVTLALLSPQPTVRARHLENLHILLV